MAGAYTVALWLSKVIDNWPTVVGDGAERSQELMVDLNQKQLYAGTKKTGEPITPKYKQFTIAQKIWEGQPHDRVTLKNTGEFYSKMFLRISGSYWSITSSDWKTTDLTQKYTSDIFGLTSESRRILWVEQLRKEIINIIKQYR